MKGVKKMSNEKLKDFSIEDLFNEIRSRSKVSALITEEQMLFNENCNLYTLLGTIVRLQLDIIIAQKQKEIEAAKNGILPARNKLPKNFKM
jgi:hypothetical protein